MEERKGFGSNFGFIMAAVGSAVGLGNIWGFPNKMGASGGALLPLPIAPTRTAAAPHGPTPCSRIMPSMVLVCTPRRPSSVNLWPAR